MQRTLASVLLIIACVLSQAYGSESSNNHDAQHDADARQPKIAIISPTDGSAVTSSPAMLEVKVGFGRGAGRRATKALLNGVDITSQFSPGAHGVLEAQVDRPAVNLGRNQLQVISGDAVVSSTFFVSLSPAPEMPGSEASLPLLVPIKTRVLTGPGTSPSDFNIALYKDPNNPTTPTPIPAPALSDGSNTGFQLVYLRRTDLAVVENISIPNPDLQGDNNDWPLIEQLQTTPSGCGSAGCLLIIQSLGNIGYAPCAAGDQKIFDCGQMSNNFQDIGGSGRIAWANGDSDVIAYSFIGNTSAEQVANEVPAGTYFESLTCKSDNYGGGAVPCDFLGFPNTSFTAPQNATPDQIGNISGVLIRDNFRNYTFTYNAPPVPFSTSTDLQTLTHTVTVNGVAHVSQPLQGAPGGFHLLILNRKTLEVVREETFPSQPDASEVDDWYSVITGYKDYGHLFILSAFGDTTYTGNTDNRARWYQGSQLIAAIGGTQQAFYLMNNPENTPVNKDDYTLVGFFVDQLGVRPVSQGTGLENQVGAELSSVIARETQTFMPPSDMEGLLRMDHQGFYSPRGWGYNNGFMNVALAEALAASLLAPTPWPFPGPDPAKSQAAYTWISQQLCCDDIRQAYVNLNVSPTIWLVQLQGLSFNPAELPTSDEANFDAVKQQLATEFEYVTLVRQFQSNVLSLYQDQQANVSLLLQEALDKVIANLKIDLNTPAHSASWVSIVADLFSVGEALAGFIPGRYGPGTGTALAVGSLIIDQVADATNTPAGSSLWAEENSDTTAGNMANKAADAFSRSLVSVGNQFDRIVTDWGRLKTLGGPLAANQLPWDSTASGILLQSYDTRVSREYYTQLLKPNTVVQVVPYTGDHIEIGQTFTRHNDICDWESFVQDNPQLLYYPNGQLNNDENDPHGTDYPFDYQWGMWTLIFSQYQNSECPGNEAPFPSTFGLFQPLDPANSEALGTYRLWFYTRGGSTTVINNDNTPCYEGSC